MKTKLPQDMSWTELEDLMFLVIKTQLPDLTDEGVEYILGMYQEGVNTVYECDEYYEVTYESNIQQTT